MYGSLYGPDLDLLFDRSDIGIGSLGRHRSNITYIKTLKNREYAARGIPFVYSEIDDDFEKMPYIMKVPANESPVDINKIIHFFIHLEDEPEQIYESVQHLSWKNQMQKVLDSIV